MLTAEIKASIQNAFRENSLGEVKTCGWKAWVVKSDEFELVLVPDVIKRYGGYQILGVLSIRIAEFEKAASGSPLSARKTFYLGSYITNFREFFSPVLINNVEEVSGVIDAMFSSIASAFATVPLRLEDLRNDLANSRVGCYDIKLFWSQDGKTQELLDWLEAGVR